MMNEFHETLVDEAFKTDMVSPFSLKFIFDVNINKFQNDISYIISCLQLYDSELFKLIDPKHYTIVMDTAQIKYNEITYCYQLSKDTLDFISNKAKN